MLITSTFNKFYLNFYLNIKSGIKQISRFTPLFHSVKLFLLYDYFLNSTQIKYIYLLLFSLFFLFLTTSTVLADRSANPRYRAKSMLSPVLGCCFLSLGEFDEFLF